VPQPWKRGCVVLAAVSTVLSCGSGADTSGANAGTAPVVSARVTAWQDGAQAAYSLIHDDVCANAEGVLAHAVPELRARGMRAGLATVAGSCASSGFSAQLPGLAAEGFEIVNHSYSHPHVTSENASLEIDEARRLLEFEARAPVTFYAFPFDDFNDATIALVRASGHLGARAGGGGVNPPDFADPFRARFEVYGGNSSHGTGPASLDRFVDAALAAGGWALRECHGVADSSWEPVPLATYRAHLDRVRGQVETHQLWMATPSTVVRYRLARQRCGVPRLDGSRVSFVASEACNELRPELTLALTLSAEAPGVSVRAGDQDLPVRRGRSSEWIVTVDPRLPADISIQAR
jgi:peptidoglycan/xylan/chitin deacetylase (PgdA/CDA1 family)